MLLDSFNISNNQYINIPPCELVFQNGDFGYESNRSEALNG